MRKFEKYLYRVSKLRKNNVRIFSYRVEEIDLDILEKIKKNKKILMNGLFEGETKFAYTNAIVDAHQFVITMIK